MTKNSLLDYLEFINNKWALEVICSFSVDNLYIAKSSWMPSPKCKCFIQHTREYQTIAKQLQVGKKPLKMIFHKIAFSNWAIPLAWTTGFYIVVDLAHNPIGKYLWFMQRQHQITSALNSPLEETRDLPTNVDLWKSS